MGGRPRPQGWARAADEREPYAPGPCGAYCLEDGKLRGRWELAKHPEQPGVELMLHGWEGGTGLPDCLCAARPFEPGETWTAYLSFSRGPGWRL